MIALRLVIDTNILVSAALQPDGLQRTVFRLAITKPARLYVSSVVLDEYREVLRPKELQIRKGLQQQLSPACPEPYISRHAFTVHSHDERPR